jgi:hypothetical protein
MTFVVFAWSGVERSLPEEDALAVAEHLRAKAELHPSAGELADRVEAEARGGTFEQPAQNVTLDEEGFRDLGAALDRLETLGALTAALRSLQMALRGERRPGEPGYR